MEIGINYYGSDAELKGCINDVHNVQRFIMGECFPLAIASRDHLSWCSRLDLCESSGEELTRRTIRVPARRHGGVDRRQPRSEVSADQGEHVEGDGVVGRGCPEGRCVVLPLVSSRRLTSVRMMGGQATDV